MIIFNNDNIKSRYEAKSSESYFACSPTSCFTIWRGLVWDQLCQHKIGYALQPVAIIAAVIFGIFTHNWYPLVILLVLNLILRGAWMVNFFRMAKSLADNDTGIRVDYLGLSLIVKNDSTGFFVRGLTEKWCDIKEVRVYKTFIVVEMRDDTDGLSMFYLRPIDLKECLDTILWYWSKTLQSQCRDNDFQTIYSADERNEISSYLELKVGPIAFIDEEKPDGKMQIAIAYIPPTDERDYYTLCTMGAGAVVKAEDADMVRRGECLERREYMMYVPKSFNLNENNYGDADRWWPAMILKALAHDLTEFDHIWDCTDIICFGESLDKSTTANGATLDYPLPDMDVHTIVSLPSGFSVEFIQAIPIASEEVKIDDYEERMAKIMGIQAKQLDKENLSEIIERMGPDACREALLKHFESLLK